MSWLKHLSAQVVRIMLDYTDQVSFCTKLKETLMEQKQWPEICHIQSKNSHDPSHSYFLICQQKCTDNFMCINCRGFTGNARSLKHLCRLQIREHLSRLRLRAPVFINFLPLPARLKDYLRYKEFDVYSRGSMFNP